MAVRVDACRTTRSPVFREDGTAILEGWFAKSGVLEYKTPDGKIIREFRPPEENAKAAHKWGLIPVTLEHPPGLLDSSSNPSYLKGLTGSEINTTKDGFIGGFITVTHKDAVDSIVRKETVELSTGYKCRIDHTPGVWKGQKYDRIQRDIEPNHVALTAKGRAGPEVALHLDSADDDFAYQLEEETMGTNPTITTRLDMGNGVIIDNLDPSIHAAIAPRFDDLNQTIAKLTEEKNNLEQENEEWQSAYQEIASLVIKEGYEWDDQLGTYVRGDSKKSKAEDDDDDDEPPKKKSSSKGKSKAKDESSDDGDEDDDDDEEGYDGDYADDDDEDGGNDDDDDDDEDDDDDDDEEEPPTKKPAKKMSAKKSTKKDSSSSDLKHFAARLAGAAVLAQQLNVQVNMDSVESPEDIYDAIIKEHLPEINPEMYSAAYKEGVIESLLDQALKTDSEDESKHTKNLTTAVWYTQNHDPEKTRKDSAETPEVEAWKQPLALNKK